MKKFKWLLGLIVVAALALAGFTYLNKAKKAEFVKAKVQRGDIDAVISATGTVNPEISVAVGSVVSGVIIDLMADYNTQVKVDQLVAVIDPAPFQAKVDQAQANLEAAKASIINAQIAIKTADLSIANSKATLANQQYGVVKAKSAVSAAKITLDRSKKLLAAGVGLQSDLDTAQANYDQSVAALDSANAQVDAAKASLDSTMANRELADTQMTSAKASVETGKANLDNAQLDLLHTKILSPVNGVVIARNMDKGQTVQASTQAPTLFQIARDLTKMQVETNIDESDISRVQLGQDGSFTVDAYPGQTFHGSVTQIRRSPVNVQNVITYTTVIQVANPDLKLFPGMTANVRLVTEHIPNVIKIPSAAVRFRPTDDLLTPEAKAARDKVTTAKSDTKSDAKADGKAEAKTGGGFDPSQFKGRGGDGGGGGFRQGGGGGGFRGGGRGRGGDFAAKQAGGAGTGTRSQAQTVYTLDDKGQLQPQRIRVGVADGNFIAMVSGSLKEGDEVVTSILNPKPTAAATGNAPGFPGGGNNNNFKQGKNFGF